MGLRPSSAIRGKGPYRFRSGPDRPPGPCREGLMGRWRPRPDGLAAAGLAGDMVVKPGWRLRPPGWPNRDGQRRCQQKARRAASARPAWDGDAFCGSAALCPTMIGMVTPVRSAALNRGQNPLPARASAPRMGAAGGGWVCVTVKRATTGLFRGGVAATPSSAGAAVQHRSWKSSPFTAGLTGAPSAGTLAGEWPPDPHRGRASRALASSPAPPEYRE